MAKQSNTFTRDELLKLGLEPDDLASTSDMPSTRGGHSAFRQSKKFIKFLAMLEAVKRLGKRPPYEVSLVFRNKDLEKYFHGEQRVLAAKMNVVAVLKRMGLTGMFTVKGFSKPNEVWVVAKGEDE